MSDHTKQVVLAFLFWLVFGIPIALVIPLLPVAILAYALGNDNIRNWIYRTGKAMDQLCNAALCGGLPQETVSSHAGRWYQHVVDNPADNLTIPLRFRFVRWLTDKFETGHIIKAIEPQFIGEEL